MPKSQNALFELISFRIAFFTPIVISSLLSIYIACSSNLEFALGYSALNFALLEVFKVPLAILALIIPGVALVTANHRSVQSKKQIEISINHNILSVRPYLTALTSSTHECFSYSIKNDGVGPANVKNIDVFCHDSLITPQEFKSKLSSLLGSLAPNSKVKLDELINSYMIAKDDDVSLIQICFDEQITKENRHKFNKIFFDFFKFKIQYESIYEEKNELIDNMDTH
jgi:hypothetical protein